MIPDLVCAVTVTYGARASLVGAVVRAALDQGVGRVVVVDNGAHPTTKSLLERLGGQVGSRLAIVPMDSNMGSAAGFGAGLHAALANPSTPWIWLLDDDNEPEDGALSALLSSYCRHRGSAPEDCLALLSLRASRPLLLAAARAGCSELAYPARSSFLNVNIRDLRDRLSGRIHNGELKRRAARHEVELPYGPYGGLFVHRSLIEAIGLPDERFVVYEDDAEFTSRIVKRGGRLVLVPSSRLRELDASWYAATPGRTPWTRLLAAPSERRLYYSVRNRSFFEFHHWRASSVLYRVNQTLYLFALAVAAATTGRWMRYQLIRTAVRDGQHGRLGPRHDLED